MAKAIFLDQFPEFLNLLKVGHEKLTAIMDGLNASRVDYIEFDNRIKGLNKLNVFVLVNPELYDIVKDQSWSSGGSSWAGFKGPPTNVSHDVMAFHPPSKPLPGGKIQEVGGYEKDPSAKYYDANEPNLNLEFKWNSGDRVEINSPVKGKHQVPALSYVLNVHVKSVPTDLTPKNIYNY